MSHVAEETKSNITQRIDLLAVSDLHSPMFFEEFKSSLLKHERPDVLLLAGDIAVSRRVSEYVRVVDAIEERFGQAMPILACYGNEESGQAEDEVARLAGGRVEFLVGRLVTLRIRGIRLGVIGAPAPLTSRGTSQARSLSQIGDVFDDRARDLSEAMQDAAASCDHTILLMHYSPLQSCRGISQKQEYSWWISKALGRTNPDFIVHGHVHAGPVRQVLIRKTKILNVAFPAVGGLTRLTLLHSNRTDKVFET